MSAAKKQNKKRPAQKGGGKKTGGAKKRTAPVVPTPAPQSAKAEKESPTPEKQRDMASTPAMPEDSLYNKTFVIGAAVITVVFIALLIGNRLPVIRMQRQLAEARAASRGGNLERARAIYGRLAADDMHNATLHLELANVILKQARGAGKLSEERNEMLQEALESYSTAYKADPPNISVRQGVASVYIESRRERIALLDKSADSLSPEFKKRVIGEIEQLGREAQKFLMEAIRIDSDNPGSSYQLAQLYEENDQPWKAAERYVRIVHDERYGPLARERLAAIEEELIGLATDSEGAPKANE